MKKRFLFPVITSLALLFALTGCNTPISDVKLDVDETENVNNPALPGPANVKADAHEGIIIVTWNQVKDAERYQVYRRDDVTGVVKELTATPSPASTFYYVDVVSVDNQLVDKRSYTYTVVSVSGKSPNARAVITQTDVIWNGQSSATATAKIPDRSKIAELDWIKAPAPAEVGFVHHEGFDFDNNKASNKDSITWPVKPNLSYTAVLQYGSEPTGTDGKSTYPGKALPIYSKSLSDAERGDGPYDPLGYAKFPSIGGTNTIKITTTFIDDGEYYTKVDAVTIPVTAATYTVIPAPVNFTAARLNDTNTVQLYWKTVEEANAYSVYRIEYTVAGDYETYLGPWVKITTTGDLSEDGNYFAKDTADVTKSYKYFVVAENVTLGAKSYPSDLASLETIVVPQPQNFKVELVKAAYGDASETDVQISWTQGSTGVYDTGITYELSRAVIEYNTPNGLPPVDNDNDNQPPFHVIGSFVPVSLTDAEVQGKGVVKTEKIGANGLAIRTYYVYKLVQKKGGVYSEPEYKTLEEKGAFSKVVNLTLTANADTEVDEHGKVTLRLTDGGSKYLKDITSIKIFKRDLYNNNPQSTYAEINTTGTTQWTTIAKDGTLRFVDSSVQITGDDNRYEYKAVAYTGTGASEKELYNANTHERATHAAWAHINNARIAESSVLGTANAAYVSELVTLEFDGSYLTGAPPIKVSYRGKTVNEYNGINGQDFEADKAFAGGTGNEWTAISGATIATRSVVVAGQPTQYIREYAFPTTHNFELGKVYQIRVNAGWTQVTGSATIGGNTLDQEKVAEYSYYNTVRTGYIEVADYYIDGTYPDGTKGITLKSNYIKWSGTPTITVYSQLKNPPIPAPTDRSYTPADFTLAGLQAVFAPAVGPNLNGKTFEKSGTINIPYANRYDDVQYYIVVTGVVGGYKGTYNSKNNSINGGILQYPDNAVTGQVYRVNSVQRLADTSAEIVFSGANLLGGGLTVQYRDRNAVATAPWSPAPAVTLTNGEYKTAIGNLTNGTTYSFRYKDIQSPDYTVYNGTF